MLNSKSSPAAVMRHAGGCKSLFDGKSQARSIPRSVPKPASPISRPRPSFTNLSESCFNISQFSPSYSSTPYSSISSVPSLDLDNSPLYLPPARNPANPTSFGLGPSAITIASKPSLGSAHELIGPVQEGCGGVYLVRHVDSDVLKVFKPTAEEGFDTVMSKGQELRVALKRGVRWGQATTKEIAAFQLDHERFARVPVTEKGLVEIDGEFVNGSLQEFHPHVASCEDMGSSRFSADSVHRIGLFDLRILNLDRHLGNILVTSDGNLVPIDHGYILPSYEDLGDVTLEWLYWQQCRQPFSEEIIDYVESLDVTEDMLTLEGLGLSRKSLVAHFISGTFLKACVKAGLTLFEIGSMYQSEDDQVPSALEALMKSVVQQSPPTGRFYKSIEFETVLASEVDAVLRR